MQIDYRPKRVINVISNQIGESVDYVQPEKELKQDLNCDSLDCVEIMIGLEEEFNIELNDDAFLKLVTVQNVIDHILDVCNTEIVSTAARINAEYAAQVRPDNSVFSYAQKITSSARELDWLKNESNPTRAAEAQKHINTLHACAIQLAGSRAHELYATEKETNELIPYLARTIGCAVEEERA